LKSGKLMEITLEITDGGSSNKEGARAAVDALDREGVVTRAFQIGTVSAGERAAFDEVWNTGRAEPYGQVVGPDIAQLIPAVTQALKRYLGAVRL
jgi:hypothetical protein